MFLLGGAKTTKDGKEVWTSSNNTAYTMTTTSFDGSGVTFKFNANTDVDYTITVPSGIIVKQFIIKEFRNNYSGKDAQLKTVTSEGATVTMPTYRKCVYSKLDSSHEGPAYDLVVNIEDHTAGTPIVFTMKKDGQPMGWIQLTTISDSALDIDNANADSKAVKVLRNGQVLILRDGRTYNMMGVEVK